MIVFHVMHDDELTFPFDDNTLFRGLEEPIQLHAEPRALRKSYLEAVEGFLADALRLLETEGVTPRDLGRLAGDGDILDRLDTLCEALASLRRRMGTVATHLKHIFTKLDVTSRVELARLAAEA